MMSMKSRMTAYFGTKEGRQLTAMYWMVFAVVLLALLLFPPRGGYIWEPWVINTLCALLFALFVALTVRLLTIRPSLLNGVGVAAFLAFFSTSSELFFQRDEMSLIELSSQCIVPFFIMQYVRVSRKNFGRWYLLMLLMGIFCSYTHNGITVPLCLSFLWLSFRRRGFWRRACWPMVVGFFIGTGLSFWHVWRQPAPPPDIADVGHTATTVWGLLWSHKVIVYWMALSVYLSLQRNGRRTIHYMGLRHRVLGLCLLMSILTLPLALLGVANAVEGLCFFTMLWSLALSQFIVRINLKNTYNHYAIRKD